MIETKRIKLYPTSREQMEKIIAAEPCEALKVAYSEMLEGCLQHIDEWEWYAMWNIELNNGTRVGDLCFKGLDSRGVVEIGYTQIDAPPDTSHYRNPTYNIVSIMAFLIGVDRGVFETDSDEPRPQLTVFDKLKTNKNARIIRNLCIVRNGIEKYYIPISRAFVQEFKSIGTVPNYIPSGAVEELSRDGISLHRSRPDVDQYLIDINREIGNRINNIKSLFPEWLKWDYIRALFIMPNGQKVEGIKVAGAEYNSNRNRYPYQCYINWNGGDNGNILYNDEKFVKLF